MGFCNQITNENLPETFVSGRLKENSLSTCALDGHLQRVMIPDAVLIQFDLLIMSMTVLKTCRGL
jgi:hypothetical protein